MIHKILILILFFGILVTLSSGFRFLLKDIDAPESKRTLYALGTRIGLAISLILVVGHGLATGKIGTKPVWDRSNTELARKVESAEISQQKQ